MIARQEIGINSHMQQQHDEAPGVSVVSPSGSDDPPDWMSDNSVSSSVLTDKDRRFTAGKLAMRSVLLLFWAFAAFRVYEVSGLVQLLQRLRTMLEVLEPALDPTLAYDGRKSDPIIAWLIVILAYNLAVTVSLFANLLYVVFVHNIRPGCSAGGRLDQLSAKRIKCLLRTMGTLLFYFALLPESVGILVLSGMVRTTGQLVDKRCRTGAVSVDTAMSIANEFDCNYDGSRNGTLCWVLDEGNMTRVSRRFYSPMSLHLKQCHLPEAFSQMALILVAFLVTHVIRSRGSWELDYRQLLEQTAFVRLAEQRRSGGFFINAQNPKRFNSWRRKKNA